MKEKRITFSLQGEITVYMIASYGHGRLHWPLVESKLYTFKYSFNVFLQSSGKWSVDYFLKNKAGEDAVSCMITYKESWDGPSL